MNKGQPSRQNISHRGQNHQSEYDMSESESNLDFSLLLFQQSFIKSYLYTNRAKEI